MREYHKWRIYYKKRVSGSACAAPHPMAVPAVGWDVSVRNVEPWLTGSGTWQALSSVGGGCWLPLWCKWRGSRQGPCLQLPAVLRCAPAARPGLTVTCLVHDLQLGLAAHPQHMCWCGSSRATAHPQRSGWAGICWHATGSHVSPRQRVLPGRPGGSASLPAPALRHAGTTTLASHHAGWSVVQPPPQLLAQD